MPDTNKGSVIHATHLDIPDPDDPFGAYPRRSVSVDGDGEPSAVVQQFIAGPTRGENGDGDGDELSDDAKQLQADIGYGPPTGECWEAIPDPDDLPDEPAGIVATPKGRRIVAEGLFTSVFGGMSSGKTWTALLTAVEALKQNRRVLFIDGEMSAPGLSRRFVPLGAHPGIRNINKCRYVSGSNIFLPDSIEDYAALRRWVSEGEQSGVVIIDSIGSIGGHTDSAKEWYLFYSLVIHPWKMPDWGCAVVGIDHDVKSSEGRSGQAQRSPIGSVGKGNSGDLVFEMTPASFTKEISGGSFLKKRKDRASLIADKQDGEIVARLTVRHDVSTGASSYTIEDCDVDVTKANGGNAFQSLEDKIMAGTKSWKSWPMSKNKIYEEVGGKKQNAMKIVDSLVDSGELELVKVSGNYEFQPKGWKPHNVELSTEPAEQLAFKGSVESSVSNGSPKATGSTGSAGSHGEGTGVPAVMEATGSGGGTGSTGSTPLGGTSGTSSPTESVEVSS